MNLSLSQILETAVGFVAASLALALVLALLGFTSVQEVAESIRGQTDETTLV